MGDIGRETKQNGNGVVMEDHLRACMSTPDPSSISEDCWVAAEETTQEVLNSIHPTLDSEEKRKDVIDYVQRLVRGSLGYEVFPYGSVPLKTYLPDGDIDLTALSSPNVEESMARDVLAVLQGEERNENAEYDVKDTQFIDAEVKLVKCLVQNIVVDISFNQLGGLCTLCFLEQVDRLVGKNHLFKRSIILTKAWCYYESRILGAHHGLISTYALETLVLYIFNMFHSSLDGPLAVLYRFLDYFSKFDWENYCISLNGPVCKSSLPDLVVEMPEKARNTLMLSGEFMKNCLEMFSIPSKDLETNARAFPQKHLNIIDPLKEYNNLGRSVHRGNFYRIRSAFKHGARKLGRVLLLPRDKIAGEMRKFFGSTFERHGRKHENPLQDSALTFGFEGSVSLYSSSSIEAFSDDDMLLKSYISDFESGSLCLEDKSSSGLRTQLENDSVKCTSEMMISDTSYMVDDSAVSGDRLAGDANDLATSSSLNLRSPNATSDFSPSSSCNGSLLGHPCLAEHFHFSKSSFAGDGNFGGNYYHCNLSDSIRDKFDLDLWLENGENFFEMKNTYESCIDNHEGTCSSASAVSSPKTNTLESLSLDFRERGSVGTNGDAEALNPLADLTGDYDSHIRSLVYGQCCHGFASSAPMLSNPSSPSGFRSKKLWETVRQSMPLKPNSFPQMNPKTLFSGPPVYHSCNSAPSGSAISYDVKQKTKGTGTYLPNMNFPVRERHSQGRENKMPGVHGQLQRNTRTSGWSSTSSETSSSERGSHETVPTGCLTRGHVKSPAFRQSYSCIGGDTHANGFLKSHHKIHNNGLAPGLAETSSIEKDSYENSLARISTQGHWKPPVIQQPHTSVRGDTCTNGLSKSSGDIGVNGFSTSCRLQFGSLGDLPEDVFSDSSHCWGLVPRFSIEVQHSKPILQRKERVAGHTFRLKNEDEFPPLSL